MVMPEYTLRKTLTPALRQCNKQSVDSWENTPTDSSRRKTGTSNRIETGARYEPRFSLAEFRSSTNQSKYDKAPLFLQAHIDTLTRLRWRCLLNRRSCRSAEEPYNSRTYIYFLIIYTSVLRNYG